MVIEAFNQVAGSVQPGSDRYRCQVHRYLRHRLASYDYERDFGGVYYLFLRGMNARRGADYGIFYRRPERALVEALDRYFLTGAVAAGESAKSCP